MRPITSVESVSPSGSQTDPRPHKVALHQVLGRDPSDRVVVHADAGQAARGQPAGEIHHRDAQPQPLVLDIRMRHLGEDRVRAELDRELDPSMQPNAPARLFPSRLPQPQRHLANKTRARVAHDDDLRPGRNGLGGRIIALHR